MSDTNEFNVNEVQAESDALQESKKKKKKSLGWEILSWVRDILIAVLIAVLISFIISPTIVQQRSMEDTLHNGDYLMMLKMAYKFGDQPKYGDIVVFESNLKDNSGNNKLLIKRVIGVGGDIVSVKDGYVYRNGKKLSEPYTKDNYTNGDMDPCTVPQGKIFVLGDNRVVSDDSRDPKLGFVDVSSVVGKALFRLYPFDVFGDIYTNYTAETE